MTTAVVTAELPAGSLDAPHDRPTFGAGLDVFADEPAVTTATGPTTS